MQRQNRRNQRLYNQLKAELILMLGGCCKTCKRVYTEDVSWIFHHPEGKDWASNGTNSLTRIRRYRKDFESGNLELQCASCHNKENK